MKFQHRCVLPGTPEHLWTLLLNVPEVAKCIAGAGDILPMEHNAYSGSMRVKIGPAALDFHGKLTLEEERREDWRASFRSEATNRGLAGGIRVQMSMQLHSQGPQTTELVVDTDAVFMGKLGEFGYPLIGKKADAMMHGLRQKSR
ncbi:MAG: hypothetical protein EXR27_17795 [Betaproteobacteria bacterium]|nr:hypothetical protein [Betaproteobacteria bacterium]